MHALIWILTFVIGTVLNVLLGYAIGVRAGAVLLYIVEYYIAKNLCKKWDEKHPEKATAGTADSKAEDRPKKSIGRAKADRVEKPDVASVAATNNALKSNDFSMRMQAASDRRDILFKGQRPNDDDYGYSESNPIMTSTVSFSYDYLDKLRTEDGQKLTWNRRGSICMNLYGIENVMVDEYELFLNNQAYKTIYICPYGHSSDYVPKGLKLADKEVSSATEPNNEKSKSETQSVDEKMRFCRKCGNELIPGSRFCNKCGFKIS